MRRWRWEVATCGVRGPCSDVAVAVTRPGRYTHMLCAVAITRSRPAVCCVASRPQRCGRGGLYRTIGYKKYRLTYRPAARVRARDPERLPCGICYIGIRLTRRYLRLTRLSSCLAPRARPAHAPAPSGQPCRRRRAPRAPRHPEVDLSSSRAHTQSDILRCTR